MNHNRIESAHGPYANLWNEAESRQGLLRRRNLPEQLLNTPDCAVIGHHALHEVATAKIAALKRRVRELEGEKRQLRRRIESLSADETEPIFVLEPESSHRVTVTIRSRQPGEFVYIPDPDED